jgi:arylsulfatase A-like enzyme
MLELAGVSIPENLQGKLDGFSLVPLLADPNSPWHDDRILFTHVGRWKEGKPPVKLGSCSVRQRELLAVHRPKGWELYDLKKDPGEKNNLAAEKPEALASMIKAFDGWWEEVLPALENEDAIHTAPAISPYHELFAKQQAGK